MRIFEYDIIRLVLPSSGLTADGAVFEISRQEISAGNLEISS